MESEEMVCVEIEIGEEENKIFLKVMLEPFEVWVDTKVLGMDGFLCAIYDGANLQKCECGENEEFQRVFVNSDWIINEWNGRKEIIEAMIKRKQMIKEGLPELKAKFGHTLEC